MSEELDGGKKPPKGTDLVRVLNQRLAQEQYRATLAENALKAHEKVVRHINEDATPVEVLVEVSNELTAKGDPKPSARVRITRKLRANENIIEIITNDLNTGQEATAAAIQEAVNAVVGKEEEGGSKEE